MNNNKENNKYRDNVYFWLGADGQLDEVTEEEFIRRQKEWEGVRPSDFD